jgi:hypothetical protein
MNKTIGATFTLIYVVVAYFLALLMSVHGPQLIGYFATGYLVVAIIGLWLIYFFANRRHLESRTLTLLFSGVAIGVLLVAAMIASWRPLVDLDIYRMHKHAANTQVFNMRDEVLLSPKGNPIAIRLRYSMRFPDSDYFWEGPRMSPLLPEELREHSVMWGDMHVASGQVSNQMIEPPMIGTDPLKYALKYEKGKIYSFTVEMIPGFLRLNADKTKSCIMKPLSPLEVDAFQKVIHDNEAVPFQITVNGTNFTGITTNEYSLRVFYDSAISEGAFECTGYENKATGW